MSVCDKMMEPMINRMTEEQKEGIMSKNKKRTVESTVTTCGWGLFFIWIGVALFAHAGWGTGLLGVGIITLGAQVARKYFGLKLEGFWVAVGFFFVLGGVWKLLNVQLGLVPTLCIAAGVALLVSVFVGMPIDKSGKQPTEKVTFPGCSKRARCKAPEILRSEAYSVVRRNEEG